MGLFEQVSRFLEERLDEFLKTNPHLEIEALLEQLREQEQESLRLITQLQQQEQQIEQEILTLAEQIQLWHKRVQKAEEAGEKELAQKAQEREAGLLRQGNTLWGQMQGYKQQISQTQNLLQQIRSQREQVKAKAAAIYAQRAKNNAPSADTSGWQQGKTYSNYNKATDPLEQIFERWETEEELKNLKKNLGL